MNLMSVIMYWLWLKLLMRLYNALYSALQGMINAILVLIILYYAVYIKALSKLPKLFLEIWSYSSFLMWFVNSKAEEDFW